MEKIEKLFLKKTKTLSIASSLILSTLQFPQIVEAKDKNIQSINTLINTPNKLKKVNENMFIDQQWQIFLMKNKNVELESIDLSQTWRYIIDNEKQIKQNDLISLQEYFNHLKWKFKGIILLKDLPFTDKFESNLINYQGNKVFMEDLLEKRYRLKGENEYKQLNFALLTLKHYLQQWNIYIELNNKPNYWYILVLKKDADELAKKYTENLIKIKEEIEKFDLSPYIQEGFTFKNEQEALLAKIYAYLYVNIKYWQPYENTSLNQNGCLTLENKEGNCDGLSKVLVSLADLYWIKLKKEEWLLWDVSTWKTNGHAWVSYIDDWMEYVLDPTNEWYIKGHPFKFWKTNFFKVPKYISEHFYFKDGSYDRNTINAPETVKISKDKLYELRGQIQEDEKTGKSYFLHNDYFLQEVFKLKEKQTQ